MKFIIDTDPGTDDAVAILIALAHFNDEELLALAGDMTEYTQRLAFNVMYSPASNLTFGVEISQANRETEANVDGDLNRLQLMAMYKF